MLAPPLHQIGQLGGQYIAADFFLGEDLFGLDGEGRNARGAIGIDAGKAVSHGIGLALSG
jgi:hypothetical protein